MTTISEIDQQIKILVQQKQELTAVTMNQYMGNAKIRLYNSFSDIPTDVTEFIDSLKYQEYKVTSDKIYIKLSSNLGNLTLDGDDIDGCQINGVHYNSNDFKVGESLFNFVQFTSKVPGTWSYKDDNKDPFTVGSLKIPIIFMRFLTTALVYPTETSLFTVRQVNYNIKC